MIVGDEKIAHPRNAAEELSVVADLDHDELKDAIKKHEK